MKRDIPRSTFYRLSKRVADEYSGGVNIDAIRAAQRVAEKWCNGHIENVTIKEIKIALVTLGNFAEDILFDLED